MKRSFISILAVAGILISGCALEEAPSSEGSIRAIMENDETRTSVTDEGKFTWSAGDQIWLGTTSGSVIGTLSTGAGTANATFSYGSFFGEMTGKAVYPYNSGHSVEGEVLDMVLPASYDLGTSLQNTNAALYGVNVDGTLKFNHLAGVMRFKFKNVPAGVNQFVITLDKKINGTFEADLTADYPVLETSATEVESEKTVTFNFDALTQTSDIMIYVPLPLGTYNSLGLALNNAEKSVWTYSNTVTNTIKRKKLILMPTVTLSGSIDGDLEGEETPADAVNLSENGTANSYIVSAAGSYKFTTVKGNSNESVGAAASAEVLWESFGTDVTPNVGDLVKNVKYADGAISFDTPSTFKEGNAVIAAKDASGNILWSWHIWLTDEPQGQEYYNNAGIMMDRNLGATSATPGDVGALGLLYQWGRKDPFLGSSSIIIDIEAKSTVTWPSSVSSDSSTGTIAYATANPTTFIKYNDSNYDWYYTGDSSTDDTRWVESVKAKSIYDPCPAGWRVPDGGSNDVWSTALGSSSSYNGTYDSTNKGMNFSGMFGSASTIWYPASGCRYYYDGSLGDVGYGSYWSASPSYDSAYYLDLRTNGGVYPSNFSCRAYGHSVRCRKEGSSSPTPSEPEEGESDYKYIVYKGTGQNNNTVTSGDSYWNLEPFFYSRVSDINEIELKFQMGPSSASAYDNEMRWLFSSERPYVNNGARLSADGLVLRYDNSGENVITNEKIITWDEMDVSITDKIILNISVSQKKISINGKEISVPELETFTSIEYLFSSYYYINDDGYAKNYATVPVESKLYYAKIWDTSGSLLYHGYASEGEKSAGNIQPVWKSEYNGSSYLEFPNTNFQNFWVSTYTTNWLPFGEGIDSDNES